MIYLWFLPALLCAYVFLKQRFLLSPTAIFVMYFAAIFPVSYLVSYALDIGSFYFVSPRQIDPGSVLLAFFQVMLSLSAFLLGRFLVPPIHIHWPRTQLIRSRFPWLLGTALAGATLGALFVLHNIGGASAIIDNSGYIRSGGLRGLGIGVFAVTNMLPTVAQFALIYAFRQRSRYLKAIFALCIVSSLLSGVFGFRSGIFMLFLQVGSICFLMTGNPFRKQALIAIPVLGLLVSGLGYVRLLTVSDAITTAAANSGVAADILPLLADTALTRTRAVETLVIMNDYMDHSHLHYFGENIKETLHAFVPSFILAKDISLSEKIGTQVYSPYLVAAGIELDVYGGVSYSLIAESVWNLGLPGVFLTGFALGYLFCLIEALPHADGISYLHLIVYKGLAAAAILFLESPQLAVNGLVADLMLNAGILVFLSFPLRLLEPAHRLAPAADA